MVWSPFLTNNARQIVDFETLFNQNSFNSEFVRSLSEFLQNDAICTIQEVLEGNWAGLLQLNLPMWLLFIFRPVLSLLCFYKIHRKNLTFSEYKQFLSHRIIHLLIIEFFFWIIVPFIIIPLFKAAGFPLFYSPEMKRLFYSPSNLIFEFFILIGLANIGINTIQFYQLKEELPNKQHWIKIHNSLKIITLLIMVVAITLMIIFGLGDFGMTFSTFSNITWPIPLINRYYLSTIFLNAFFLHEISGILLYIWVTFGLICLFIDLIIRKPMIKYALQENTKNSKNC